MLLLQCYHTWIKLSEVSKTFVGITRMDYHKVEKVIESYHKVKKLRHGNACIGIHIGDLEVNDLIFSITNYVKIKPIFDPLSRIKNWDMNRIYGYQPNEAPIYKKTLLLRNTGVELVLLVDFRIIGAMKSPDRITILFTKKSKISMRGPCLIINVPALMAQHGEIVFY